jgi:pimeloyl-ACP methyl ester carboxylesterase
MDLIDVDGAQLSALALGPAGAPAVVMLHGLVSGNMASWYSAIASPLAVERRVLIYDQRGHGGSSLPASGFDLDQQARDLQAVLAFYGLGTTPVDVVGHSMGALIALHYALGQPERLRRLVLVDAPMPACDYVAPSLAGVRSREALADYIDNHLAAAAGLKGRRRERLHQRLAALFFESTLMQDVQAMSAEPDAALAALALPVLLIYGRRSPCLAAGQHLARTLPQAELSLVEGGHYLPEEAPEALREQLQRFLAIPRGNHQAVAAIRDVRDGVSNLL